MKRAGFWFCQPASNAPAILPQPTSRIARPAFSDFLERLPARLTPRRPVRSSAAAIASCAGLPPQTTSWKREEPLAFGDRDIDQILDLLDAGADRAAQQHALAEGRRLVVGQIEMADPEALVDRR